MKKPVLLIILGLVATVLVGFGLSQLPVVKTLFVSDDSGTIPGNFNFEYWGLDIPEQAMAPVIAKYEEDNPSVNINYVQKDFEDDLDRYKTTLSNQLGDKSGPDIFSVHSTWMPELIREVSLENNAISVADYRKRFYPIAYSQCGTVEGQLVCMPISYDGLALFYNKDLFFSAGLNEPRTWEEVRDAATRLTIRDGNGLVQSGIALGTANTVDYSSDILALMMAQSDVDIPEDLNTQSAAAALEFYTNFSKVDKVWDDSMGNSIRSFATQKSAMAIGKSSDVLDILQLNPTLNMGVINLPQIPAVGGRLTSDTWASFKVETVSNDLSGRGQEEAWKFLEWLSRPEQQMMIYSEMSKYQKFGMVYSDKTIAENLEDEPYLEAIVEQAPFSTTSIVADKSGNDEYADLFKDAINRALGNSGRRADPLEILTDVQAQFDDL